MSRRPDRPAHASVALAVDSPFPDGQGVIIVRRENDGGLLGDKIQAIDRRPVSQLHRNDRPLLLVTCTQITAIANITEICRAALTLGAQVIMLAVAPWEHWEVFRSRASTYQPAGTFYVMPNPELAQLLGTLEPGTTLVPNTLRNGLCLVRSGMVAAIWFADEDAPTTPHDLTVLEPFRSQR